MDVFVFPSLWEGFGTALLEAMAAQVPIVASDLPCVREIIPDERYGSLVPPGEVGALAEAILGIWRNGKPWETRVIAAKDRAIQDFSLARVVSTYQDLYQEILSRKVPDGHP
jgi:glycosyltransferase involved in cell wall biosynthesis